MTEQNFSHYGGQERERQWKRRSRELDNTALSEMFPLTRPPHIPAASQ